jgi:hypothetical protein
MSDVTLELIIEEPVYLVPGKSVATVKGEPGETGRGIKRYAFEVGVNATEGQTEFTVPVDCDDNYMAFVNDAKQSHLVVSRSGSVFTYSAGLMADQILEIFV